jgi:hypothetical protein
MLYTTSTSNHQPLYLALAASGMVTMVAASVAVVVVEKAVAIVQVVVKMAVALVALPPSHNAITRRRAAAAR